MTIEEAQQIVQRHIELLTTELKIAEIAFHDRKRIIANLYSCEVMVKYLHALSLGIPVKWKRLAYYDELIQTGTPVKVEAS